MKKYSILLLISFIIGCSSGQNNSAKEHILNDLNTKYNKAKDFFGNDMTSHFPVKIDSLNITFTENYSPDLGNLELMIINKAGETQLMSIVNEFKDKAIYSCETSDSCLLVVNRFVSRNNYYKVKHTEDESHLISKDCYSDKQPVPNFWHNKYTSEETDCGLPKDFSIYVTEAKPGEHFDKEYLTDGNFMPANWKNGYSKGVAISEEKQVIIYWLIIW